MVEIVHLCDFKNNTSRSKTTAKFFKRLPISLKICFHKYWIRFCDQDLKFYNGVQNMSLKLGKFILSGQQNRISIDILLPLHFDLALFLTHWSSKQVILSGLIQFSNSHQINFFIILKSRSTTINTFFIQSLLACLALCASVSKKYSYRFQKSKFSIPDLD